MKLNKYLSRLFSDGLVEVPRQMTDFDVDDLQASIRVLKQVYDTDKLEMLFHAPVFEPDAALWAARFLYQATQLVLLRDLDETVIDQYLQPYPGETSAAAIYSVDLIFRHIGGLFKFSSGLAPDDPLVKRLKETMAAWPFSSVGLKIEPLATTDTIFTDASLKYAYLDRIIQHKDHARLKGEPEKNTFDEIMGMHQALLWPGFDLLAHPE
ncbi:hypothetical protein ACFFGT_06640 [Mucilaginibacter angelicae]|uniref:MoxR-vWA-beta-propeller ternary system domain-containing protein n=1 Tax=Mucilaginibacter angelicae TaxID=869718 RepID=A0ABV6L2Y9_9SPHI